MNTKMIVCVVAAALLSSASFAEAQQPTKIPRVGYLTGEPLPAISASRDAFRQGLRELGYVEEKSLVIEWRVSEGKPDHELALASELVRLKVDVIVGGGSLSIHAARQATNIIPIVMVNGGDAVGSGFVANLARPGGNITGLASLRPVLSGKRLELLKETVPKISHVAVLASSISQDYAKVLQELDTAAGAFGMTLQYLDIRGPKDIEIAFRDVVKGRADAVFFRVPNAFAGSQRPQIAELAVKSRLPVIYERAEYVAVGGLMSYGVSETDLARRAATYVDKILKGAKPADIPVEQPT